MARAAVARRAPWPVQTRARTSVLFTARLGLVSASLCSAQTRCGGCAQSTAARRAGHEALHARRRAVFVLRLDALAHAADGAVKVLVVHAKDADGPRSAAPRPHGLREEDTAGVRGRVLARELGGLLERPSASSKLKSMGPSRSRKADARRAAMTESMTFALCALAFLAISSMCSRSTTSVLWLKRMVPRMGCAARRRAWRAAAC